MPIQRLFYSPILVNISLSGLFMIIRLGKTFSCCEIKQNLARSRFIDYEQKLNMLFKLY